MIVRLVLVALSHLSGGYEDYSAAVNIVQGAEFSCYRSWLDGVRSGKANGAPPAGLSRSATPLQIKAAMASKFKHALELLRSGNDKLLAPVPAASDKIEGRFDSLARFACEAASVRFASGNWSAGVGQLIEAAKFSVNVVRAKGPADSLDLCVSAFVENQSRWSLADCRRIRQWLENSIASTQFGSEMTTKLRLLGLHSRIQEFRWQNGRLPFRLAEAVPREELADPLSGKPFEYEVRPDGTFLLSCNGLSLAA